MVRCRCNCVVSVVESGAYTDAVVGFILQYSQLWLLSVSHDDEK